MEIAKLVLEYINAVKWPAFAIAIVLFFRSQVGSFLAELDEFEFPGGGRAKRRRGDELAASVGREIPPTIEVVARSAVEPEANSPEESGMPPRPSRSSSAPPEAAADSPSAPQAEAHEDTGAEDVEGPIVDGPIVDGAIVWDSQQQREVRRLIAELRAQANVVQGSDEWRPDTRVGHALERLEWMVAKAHDVMRVPPYTSLRQSAFDLGLPGPLSRGLAALAEFRNQFVHGHISASYDGSLDLATSVGRWLNNYADFLGSELNQQRPGNR